MRERKTNSAENLIFYRFLKDRDGASVEVVVDIHSSTVEQERGEKYLHNNKSPLATPLLGTTQKDQEKCGTRTSLDSEKSGCVSANVLPAAFKKGILINIFSCTFKE